MDSVRYQQVTKNPGTKKAGKTPGLGLQNHTGLVLNQNFPNPVGISLVYFDQIHAIGLVF